MEKHNNMEWTWKQIAVIVVIVVIVVIAVNYAKNKGLIPAALLGA